MHSTIKSSTYPYFHPARDASMDGEGLGGRDFHASHQSRLSSDRFDIMKHPVPKTTNKTYPGPKPEFKDYKTPGRSATSKGEWQTLQQQARQDREHRTTTDILPKFRYSPKKAQKNEIAKNLASTGPHCSGIWKKRELAGCPPAG